uniref:Uncharacterized protein n=1 Tax=Arundo donax TaxID=35708 RepID=A0A0A8ZV05_ARUDO
MQPQINHPSPHHHHFHTWSYILSTCKCCVGYCVYLQWVKK